MDTAQDDAIMLHERAEGKGTVARVWLHTIRV